MLCEGRACNNNISEPSSSAHEDQPHDDLEGNDICAVYVAFVTPSSGGHCGPQVGEFYLQRCCVDNSCDPRPHVRVTN